METSIKIGVRCSPTCAQGLFDVRNPERTARAGGAVGRRPRSQPGQASGARLGERTRTAGPHGRTTAQGESSWDRRSPRGRGRSVKYAP